MPIVHFSLYCHIIPLGSTVLFHFVSCLYFHFVCFYLFKRAKVSDEIPEATEDYSKEFSKLSSKTEMDKVSVRVIVLKQCTVLNATLSH